MGWMFLENEEWMSFYKRPPTPAPDFKAAEKAKPRDSLCWLQGGVEHVAISDGGIYSHFKSCIHRPATPQGTEYRGNRRKTGFNTQDSVWLNERQGSEGEPNPESTLSALQSFCPQISLPSQGLCTCCSLPVQHSSSILHGGSSRSLFWCQPPQRGHVPCLFPQCTERQLLFCLFLLFSICFALCKFSRWLWSSSPIYLLVF